MSKRWCSLHSQRAWSRRPIRKSGVLLALVALSLPFSPALVGGEGATANDNGTDRSLTFVSKSVEATNLFNKHQLPEAMAAFQDLAHNYADLDEDGYATMGLADCLHAMGRDEEARKVYLKVASEHPALTETVNYHLREIDIGLGEATDALIEQLRQAVAAAGDDDRSGAQLQLGRVLQKRASALLKEAVEMFRTAAEADKGLLGQRAIANQATLLAEIQEDLASLIGHIEKTWGALRTLGDIVRDGLPDANPDPGLTDYHAEWTMTGGDQGPLRVDMTWTGGETGVRATVNGRPVTIKPGEARLIRRHQERINAILQAANRQPDGPGLQAEPVIQPQ